MESSEVEWARELARAAVRRLAPHELELFEETADVYFEDPGGTAARTRPEPLGIGIEVIAAGAWTLFALPVATAVAGNLATDALREGRGRRWWPRRRSRTDNPAGGGRPERVSPDEAATSPTGPADGTNVARGTVGPIEPGELRSTDFELIREVAYGRGVALGLPAGQARLLADAIVGGVLTGRNQGGEEGDHATGAPGTGTS
ncbi:hypothetical protein [Streptomyces sp. NPDC093261]|uniref:hypothetical protein n=1 Tax=Streptomyces sp. NPDC093261 TaxID=3366037 RepID=UPI0038221B90